MKEVLGLLRDNKRLVIKNQGVLFVGNTIKEVEKTIEELE
jgi:hypothetical protein